MFIKITRTHTYACNLSQTHIQRVPKRDPRKQEMTAEGRGRSKEKTDATRPLSKRRWGGDNRRQYPAQQQQRQNTIRQEKEKKACH